jgi:hypothetical protein
MGAGTAAIPAIGPIAIPAAIPAMGAGTAAIPAVITAVRPIAIPAVGPIVITAAAHGPIAGTAIGPAVVIAAVTAPESVAVTATVAESVTGTVPVAASRSARRGRGRRCRGGGGRALVGRARLSRAERLRRIARFDHDGAMAWFSRDARAFAEALFAGSDGPPTADRIDWLVHDLSDFVEQAGPRAWLVLSGGLELATWLAPTLIGKLPPLARLSIEDRQRALEKLEHTPAGLPLFALKAMFCIVYYEHPDVLRDIGVTRAGRSSPECLVPIGTKPVADAQGGAS